MSDFDIYFLSKFQQIGKPVKLQYGHVVESYQRFIIPFQVRRMKENQSIEYKSTQLQRDKLKLLKKIDELSNEGHQQLYAINKQQQKIGELQKSMKDLSLENTQSLNQIQRLRIYSKQLQDNLQEKRKIAIQIEQDKKQFLANLESKNKQFEVLLANYLKDKNAVAEKLNYMNDFEQSLRQKDKKLQQQEFYLKKQLQRYEQAKKDLAEPEEQFLVSSVIKKKNTSKKEQEDDEQPTESKGNQRMEILKNPVKKLIKHHTNEIYDITINYNGNLIATCGGDRTIKIYDVLNFKNGVSIQSHSVDNIYLCVGLDYSGEKLLTGSSDRSVKVYSTSIGKQLHSFVGHGYKVNSVSWTSAKEKCVSGSEDKQIKVWEIEKASNLLSIACRSPVKYLTCNTIQPLIYSGHSDGSIRLYSLNQNSSPITQIKGFIDSAINSIVVLSNRNQVLVSTQEGSPIYIIDLKMNKIIHKYEGKQYSNGSARAEISPSQRYIVAGNSDGAIYYWNTDKQNLQKRVTGVHESGITTLKYHFLSSIMVSCDKQGTIAIWQ